MKLQQRWTYLVITLALLAGARSASAASYAASVVAYTVGNGAAAGFDQPESALGAPARFTGVGVFPGAVTAFNPPFLPTEVVSIGEGGSITLALANFLLPQAGGAELGVFTNVGLIETDFPHGQAGSPLSATEGTFGADRAILEVSANGTDWFSLSEQWFDVPTIGYSDVIDPFATDAGQAPSDFSQPFAGALADLAELKYHDPAANDILDVFNGSGGGTWVDLSQTGIAQIGWLRFSVPDDGNDATHNKFDLDAVSIASSAIGPAVPEPATWVLASVGALMILARKRSVRLG